MTHKMRELKEKYRAKRQEIPTSIDGAATLADRLLSSVHADVSTAGRAARGNCGEELGLKPVIVTDEQNRSRKALVDAQIKETCEGLACKLESSHNMFMVCEYGLLRERDK